MTTSSDPFLGASDASKDAPTPTGGSSAAGAGSAAGAWAEVRAEAGAPRPGSCALLASAAAELALGSLMGSERSWALAHLDGCDCCAALVADLACAADALMLIAPAVDPPPGFEVRWLSRVTADRSDAALAAPRAKGSTSRRTTDAGDDLGRAARAARVTRLRPRALVAAGVAALMLAGAGVGVGVAIAPKSPGPSPTTAQVRLAALRSAPGLLARGDAASGEVAIVAGSPSWVVMNYRQPGWSGRVTCVVIENGHPEELGSFWIYDGAGSWTVRLGSPGGAISSAEVRSLSGAVLAMASFVN